MHGCTGANQVPGVLLWYMSKNRKLPKIGSLVKLKSWSPSMGWVKVESLFQSGQEDEVVCRDFPVGTIALVVDHKSHPDGKEGEIMVPIVLVDNFQGWIFADEWTRLTAERQKLAT